MGFFLTDAVESALTPQGTNARRGQEQQQKEVGNWAYDLAQNEHDYLGRGQRYRSDNWGTTAGALDTLGKWTTQGGRDDWTHWYTGQQQAAARDAGTNAGTMFAGNPELAQSYALDQMNQANTRSANYQAEINSPVAMQKALMSYLQSMGLVTDGTQFNNYAGTVFRRPAVAVGQGLGGMIGQLAANYFTGGTAGTAGAAGGLEYAPGDGYTYNTNTGPFVTGYGPR